jgi:hypothetical protein
MADFDWTWPTRIERALRLDFSAEERNLVLVGANGLGKTMVAQNICHAAVLAGHSVLLRTASALLEQLHRQTPEGRLRKLRAYANVALLCIDEVGYLSFDDKSADLLYEVINRCYEQKSLILTTNKPFKEWSEVFPNAACIATLLDRLLHHAEVTVIEGSSYRVRESEQETTAHSPPQEEEMSHPDAPASCVAAVVTLYLEMPDTPMRVSVSDQWLARYVHQDGMPLETVVTALLLGSLLLKSDKWDEQVLRRRSRLFP